jgi:uncharacterized lipoprotein
MFLSVETQDKLILWNRIKSFWLEEGFQLLSEDLTISSMRTNYLENLSEVQLGCYSESCWSLCSFISLT